MVNKRFWVGGFLPLILLVGCGENNQGANLKAAALVDGQVVAVAQVESELRKLGQVPVDQTQTVANRILANIVNQELLAQQAEAAKLAEKEEVAMKIAAARRQILAEARAEALSENMAKPTDGEIKAYFDAHPELFAKRRIYKLQELIIATTPENIGQIRELVGKAKSPRELAQTLQAKGIQVGARQLVKPAEDIPTELLTKLATLKIGESVTLSRDNKLDLLVLIGAEDRPVAFEQVTQDISRYLTNSRKRDLIEAELKKAKAQAKVEYKPPYSEWNNVEADK